MGPFTEEPHKRESFVSFIKPSEEGSGKVRAFQCACQDTRAAWVALNSI